MYSSPLHRMGTPSSPGSDLYSFVKIRVGHPVYSDASVGQLRKDSQRFGEGTGFELHADGVCWRDGG